MRYMIFVISFVTCIVMANLFGAAAVSAEESATGSGVMEIAAAQSDKDTAIKKALGLKGAQSDQEYWQLKMCMASMKNIGTGLEMYATDNGGRYPASLSKLTPAYLKTLPRYQSSKGEFGYEQGYKVMAGGKSYVFTCTGGAFTSINVPAGYPRYTAENGIEIKPGLFESRLTQKDKAMKLFEEGIKNMPTIFQSKNKEQASAARAKLRAAIDSGGLSPSEKSMAEKVIKDYDKIINGTK
jgi:hypothetical protein